MSRKKTTSTETETEPMTTTPTLRLRVVGRMQTPSMSGPTMNPNSQPGDDTCTCILVESIDQDGNTIPQRMQQMMGGNTLMIPTGMYLDEATLPKGTIVDLIQEA